MTEGDADVAGSKTPAASHADVAAAPTLDFSAQEAGSRKDDLSAESESRAHDVGANVGHPFGDYDLLSEIARGGMGVVFKALDRKLNRVVALKMILSGRFAAEQDLRRFRIEAEAAAKLDHPGIVPIYEIGQFEGQHYFTMKLVPGGSLADRMAELRKEPRAAVSLLAKVSRAVAHAHQRGILHRDLKPSNILIDEAGEPLVSDLGLAKSVSADSQLTQSGAIVGTPGYMSPEQAMATSDITTGADIYALGAILYEAIAGRPPHQAATALDTLLKVINESPAQPRSLNPAVDPGLELIALKCLGRSPAERYSSATALADDLDRWLAGEPLSVRPPSMASAAQLWLRRNLRSAAGAAVVGLVAGVACGVTLWFTAISPQLATSAAVYDAFPSEPRPWGAFGVRAPNWVRELTLGWLIWLLMFVGLINVAVVRPVRRAGWLASGAICGLSLALGSYAVSFGWGPIVGRSVEPSREDVQLLSRAMFVESPADTQRLQRAILRRHPDLARLEPEARADFLSAKIALDQIARVPGGMWLGVMIALLAGLLPAFCGTLLAGSLLEREGKLSRVVGPYCEVMGSATSICVIGVAYWTGALTWLRIASPPAELQIPFFASLALACWASLHRWTRPVRLVIHAVWVVALVLTVAFFVRLSHTFEDAGHLVAQGDLPRAAQRMERYIRDQPRDALGHLGAGVLRLQLGEIDRYRGHCDAMLSLFGGSHSPADADKTAKLCLLVPGSTTDIGPALVLAELAVDEGYQSPYEGWFQLVRGLAEHRAGHWNEAIGWLEKCRSNPNAIVASTARLVESMALGRLGRTDEAGTAFREATAKFEDYLATAGEGDIVGTWPDRMIFEILRKEAMGSVRPE
ncbi:MAG TPA: serine/threonine-protein kinase [Pirellulales bacterium]|nr:serine/threonine-protein kinase [Pirellulales bacterium]